MGCVGSKPKIVEHTPENSANKPSSNGKPDSVVQETKTGDLTNSNVSSKPAKVGESAEAKEVKKSISFSEEMIVLRAALRIQRKTRVRAARRKVLAAQQWKMFNDIDAQDENETLQLAVFLQALMDHVPTGPSGLSSFEAQRQSSLRAINQPVDNDDHDGSSPDTISLDNISVVVRNQSQALSPVPFRLSPAEVAEYTMPKGDMSPEMCDRVLEVLVRGGKLSLKSVQKILRVVYKTLKGLTNNIVNISSNGAEVHVVGDIHGQLPDLLRLLKQHNYPPAANNIFLFNGDFVDRGPQGCEVICMLFALMATYPGQVYLNRGNHEDHSICTVYGFQKECKDKYDELTFGMFVEVFRFLPLATIIDEAIFVLHGGLFFDLDINVRQVLGIEVDRTDYMPKPPVPYPQVLETVGLDADDDTREALRKKEYLKQIQRDALWSDPQTANGVIPNPRGAGIMFGPDITDRFLRNNRFDMLIRSHECVSQGFDLPYSPPSDAFLGTIFSASNYGGSGNDGAVVTFKYCGTGNAGNAMASNGWRRTSYQGRHVFKALRHSPADVRVYSGEEPVSDVGIQQQSQQSLQNLILKKQSNILEAFRRVDVDDTGLVTRQGWAECMLEGTGLMILWLTVSNFLVPLECVTTVGGVAMIDYGRFFSQFANLKIEQSSDVMMDALYANRSKLETIFYFFDRDGNGTISREEFRTGCAFINQSFADSGCGSQFLSAPQIERLLDMMDFDKSDSIDINEFFEVFRIMDAKDGKLDGVIGLAQTPSKK